MTLTVELVRPQSLQPAPYNPRRISDEALRRLARLLDEHGFVDPVLARRCDRLVIGGHQRLRANALRERPDERVPCIFLDDLTDAQAKALTIALNNPAAQGEFDADRLELLVADLAAAELDVSAVTGLDADELADLQRQLDEPPPDLQSLQPPADEDDAARVVVILEMEESVYHEVKGVLDDLIATRDVTCRVRFDGRE